jgi:integrase
LAEWPKTNRPIGLSISSGMKGCPPLSAPEFHTALASLSGRHKWRDQALLILGVRMGMRVSELLSLTIAQVWDGKAPRARIYLPREKTKGKRTGASMVLHPSAGDAVERLIKSRVGVQPQDFLFSSQRCPHRPLGRRAAWLILHRAFKAAGVSGMVGSHCMRKTFCQNVYVALKGDLFRLSKAMRHTSPLTTLSYLSFREEEIDRAILAARL